MIVGMNIHDWVRTGAWATVTDRDIREIRYDKAQSKLYVRYKGGDIAAFENVPIIVGEGAFSAKDHLQFVNGKLEGKFRKTKGEEKREEKKEEGPATDPVAKAKLEAERIKKEREARAVHTNEDIWAATGRWQQVRSTNVARIKYDAKAMNLYVQFLDGAVYQYPKVSLQDAQAMYAAPSKGKYVWYRLRPRYGDGTKVRG